MLKKMISAVIAITMVMGMCSCSEQSSGQDPQSSSQIVQPSEPVEPRTDLGQNTIQLTADYTFNKADTNQGSDEQFLKGVNGFSVQLFKNSVKKDLADGKNTLISPESVAFALGMTMNGADGSTLKQMQDVMCGSVDTDTFNKNMNLLISNAHSSNTDDSKLNIANSLWVKDKQGLTLNEQFVQTCKQMYNAEMFRSPFDKTTIDSVNGWVNEKTDKMIPSILDKLDPNDVMCLVNCVAFDSQWEKQYLDGNVVKDSKFTNANGEEVKCTMLRSTEKSFVENSKATGFVKDYKGGKYAFMAILPNKDTSVCDYVASMTDSEIADLYAGRTKTNVQTKLPQFKFDYGSEMGDILKAMGISEAFSNSADFSKLFTNEDVCINRVIHKTHIELDAKGTKAAASTVVTTRAKCAIDSSQPKTVFLDRPFVFAIMDTASGLPVFIGTVCDPSVQ